MLRKVIFVSCLICFAFCADVYQVATYASTDCTGAFIGVRIIGSGYTSKDVACVDLGDGRSSKAFTGPIDIEAYRMAPWNWNQVQDHGTCATIDDITNSSYQTSIYIMNGTNCWTNPDGTSSYAFASCANDQYTVLTGVSDQADCSSGTPTAAATANECQDLAGAAFLNLCGADVEAPVAAPMTAAPVAGPSKAPTAKSGATVACVSAASLILTAILL